ncbi:MAG: hypothetical protein V2G41_09960 [bacterium JZ-2024 1]
MSESLSHDERLIYASARFSKFLTLDNAVELLRFGVPARPGGWDVFLARRARKAIDRLVELGMLKSVGPGTWVVVQGSFWKGGDGSDGV